MSQRTPKDGGPAFPPNRYPDHTIKGGYFPGMSLRDYFAGQALAGLLSHDAEGMGDNSFCFDSRARAAYQMADVMIEARDFANLWPARTSSQVEGG